MPTPARKSINLLQEGFLKAFKKAGKCIKRRLNRLSGMVMMHAMQNPGNASIQLLQFFICRDFSAANQDSYTGHNVLGNLYLPHFPHSVEQLFAVTCWRKDNRFHKEVIEYETDYGARARSAHMDIEPVTDSVLFRWHKHRFPKDFLIEKPAYLTVRVILDREVVWQSYILIEKKA